MSPRHHVPHPYVPMSHVPTSPRPTPHTRAAFSRAKPSSRPLVHSELFQREKHFSKGEDIPCPAVPARGDDAPQWGDCPIRVALSQTVGPSPSHQYLQFGSLQGSPALKCAGGACPHVPASQCPSSQSFLQGSDSFQTVLRGICLGALHGDTVRGGQSGPAATPTGPPHTPWEPGDG